MGASGRPTTPPRPGHYDGEVLLHLAGRAENGWSTVSPDKNHVSFDPLSTKTSSPLSRNPTASRPGPGDAGRPLHPRAIAVSRPPPAPHHRADGTDP